MATIFWINRGTALRESSLEARANIYNVYNDKCLAVFNAASRLKCHRRNVQTRRVVSRYYSFDLRNYPSPTDTRQSIDARKIPFPRYWSTFYIWKTHGRSNRIQLITYTRDKDNYATKYSRNMWLLGYYRTKDLCNRLQHSVYGIAFKLLCAEKCSFLLKVFGCPKSVIFVQTWDLIYHTLWPLSW